MGFRWEPGIKHTHYRDDGEWKEKPYEFHVDVIGDPELEREGIVVANMGVFLDKKDPFYPGVIYHLYVNPKHRKEGIGKKLLEMAEEQLCNTNFDTCKICVSPMNQEAVNFYEKQGYSMTGRNCMGHKMMVKQNCCL